MSEIDGIIFESLADKISDGIIITNSDFLITYINTCAKKNFGIKDDIINKPVNVLSCLFEKGSSPFFEDTFNGESSYQEISSFFKNGNLKFSVVLKSIPVIKNKKFSGVVLVLQKSNGALKNKKERHGKGFYGIISCSNDMKYIFGLIERLSDIDSNVLILGETGTGKELIADAIHKSGKRRDYPLIKVNCSALTETLIESELFGAVKGAYTGSNKDRKGRFENADNGTLFLDEIGELPLTSQVKLLRFLQEKEFERVGDSKTIKVDVRIIAATNKNLKDLVEEGKFRRDLYYRLNVFKINIPPLRKRGNDIILLAKYFIDFYNAKFNRNIFDFSDEVKKFFLSYYWPGNIRELKHIIEYALIMAREDIISSEDLPEDLHGYFKISEKDSIVKALEKVKWNKSKACEILGISRKTLYRKLERYKIV